LLSSECEAGLLRIIGPKREEVAGGWRRLHNEELHNLYTSPNVIRGIRSRRVRWAGHVARMGTMGNAHNNSVGKPEGKRSLGKPRCRWEDNIEMDLRDVGKCGLNASGSRYGPVADSCEHGNVPSGSIKDGEFLD
jgi:hypothetical protein